MEIDLIGENILYKYDMVKTILCRVARYASDAEVTGAWEGSNDNFLII